MKYSFIIPAFNEEKYIASCIESIKRAVETDAEYEIIVVDNCSTDNTKAMGIAWGATVITSTGRTIGQVRNDGAAKAKGELLVFIDADSTIGWQLLSQIRGDVVGGGALINLNHITRIGMFVEGHWNNYCRINNIYTGCFLFVKRDVFFALSGFNSTLTVLEDIDFSRRLNNYAASFYLKTQLIINQAVTTSDRKLRLYSFFDHLKFWLKFFFAQRKLVKERHPLWYSGRRESLA